MKLIERDLENLPVYIWNKLCLLNLKLTGL